jgi:MFS family permease
MRTRSLRGLDWLNFFMANVQTGFGPFISVYLTGQKWTQVEIGFALSVGTVVMMVSQVPAGALVDAVRDKRLAAGASLLGVALSALLLALSPTRLSVLLSQVVHAFFSCALAPSIAAISLALIGLAGVGERLGRNARFASIGNGIAAALMGAVGYYVSERAVFLLTAGLIAPALIALGMISRTDLTLPPLHTRPEGKAPRNERIWQLLSDRRLLAFSGCAILFHLSNAAMLPLIAGEMTEHPGSAASIIIAASIVVPQLVVAAVSPWVGRLADRIGRKPVLLFGFAALPLRGLLFAAISSPYPLLVVQALDGISGAVFGVMVPLIAADLTRGTNRFNLCQGLIGLAVGLGATFSTTVAGAIADATGPSVAFLALAASGLAATLLVAFGMPETRTNETISRGHADRNHVIGSMEN